MSAEDAPKVFLIAGEPSGDALGAGLMAALTARTGGAVTFEGVGGPLMAAEGLATLFPMDDLAVMGLAEVLPRLGLLIRRIGETVDAVDRHRPDVLVTIDAPDFCFRVIKKLKARGVDVPAVHYVAPSVWAWRPGRAKKVAKFLDHLLCLLPFEPPYFERVGLPATFVGHPVAAGNVSVQVADATGAASPDAGAAFRARHAIAADASVLTVLPGSRTGELDRLLPIFGAAVEKLAHRIPNLHVVMPTLAHLQARLERDAPTWAVPVCVVGPDEKADAFAAADAALAASGTVGLELARAGVAHVVAYRLNWLTAFFARRLVRTPYAHLVNIVLGRGAVPELLLENCTADNLARETARLLNDAAARGGQRQAFDEALRALGQDGPAPGERAAEVVLDVVRKHRDGKGDP